MATERPVSRRAPPFIDPPGYARHRPEETLLYQRVERHYPELVAAREAAGRPLPKYVQEEFEQYLKCGCLKYGFPRVRCEGCYAEKLVAFSCKRRGFCPLALRFLLATDPEALPRVWYRVPDDLGLRPQESAAHARKWCDRRSSAPSRRCFEDEPKKTVAQYAGFSLHAGLGVEADQREKLERLAATCTGRRCRWSG